EALPLLKGRNAWCELRRKVRRRLHLEPAGREALEAGLQTVEEVTQLTPELIASGRWREVRLRSYDVGLATDPVHPGKRHPLQRILDETRRVYLEMGFQEIVSPLAESAFWDFDALFQPQDHPAREMQDTFYLEAPGEVPLPEDSDLVDRVRRVHEDGGETGSIGWQYRWEEARARKTVLRTHTTATTVRALAADPTTPRRVFCVGRVFRRETIDYKHLPIFYQVDGIVIDPDASFANLLGTLGAFYRRMGFPQFQFRPAFFPYTEPSVEVYIWFEKRRDWVEMGGAGIFRPEVTEPLGCTVPVLAWGLGLERLAMMRYDLKDIRDLYFPDTEWLKGVPLCR
ncbi:MAG: phenylalanine--tRNA ligase subunit alpha, partial [Candidatus Eisenbacteria bacterium]|nr:phenylalanine--tRNA ligase subunit alpha [Candidatus Latescibacterota bacterium]MBD3300891.1 phenylalanine--tRNA ligase subunit alpha [Candidatus Eisenbacteria bacterium]